MKKHSPKSIINICIALIWFLNGFYCKLLNFVPRHQEIIGRILGEEHAFLFTKLIGCLEILMSFWVISRFKSRLCSWIQVILIAMMNSIEFFKVPDILLFGHGNAILALLLIIVILWNEYYIYPNRKTVLKDV
jgi:DoxX-like family